MIFGGQTVRLLKGATDRDGQEIPAGLQGMVIGFRGPTLVVVFDRAAGKVYAEVREDDVIRTSVSRAHK